MHPREIVLIKIDVAPVFLGEPIEPWFGLDGELVGHKDVFALRREGSRCAEFEPPTPTVKAAWGRAATDLWSLQALEGKGEDVFRPDRRNPEVYGLFGRDSLVAGIQSSFLNRVDADRQPPFGRRMDGERRSTIAMTPSPARSCISGS